MKFNPGNDNLAATLREAPGSLCMKSSLPDADTQIVLTASNGVQLRQCMKIKDLV